jgi:hypothetical protein
MALDHVIASRRLLFAIHDLERDHDVSDRGSIDDCPFPCDRRVRAGRANGCLFRLRNRRPGGRHVVDKVWLTGLTIGTPIVALGSFNEVATVNPVTGVVETPLLNIDAPHAMDFVAAPEPSTWAMMLLGFAGLGLMGYRASAKRRAALAA